MSAADRLAEVFDRGLKTGFDSLNQNERELFVIQDFIIEYEMGGLSQYLYNRLPEPGKIKAAIAAMRKNRLLELDALLSEATALFTNWDFGEPSETWGEVLCRVDPAGRLTEIEEEIELLDDYGLEGSAIT